MGILGDVKMVVENVSAACVTDQDANTLGDKGLPPSAKTIPFFVVFISRICAESNEMSRLSRHLTQICYHVSESLV